MEKGKSDDGTNKLEQCITEYFLKPNTFDQQLEDGEIEEGNFVGGSSLRSPKRMEMEGLNVVLSLNCLSS